MLFLGDDMNFINNLDRLIHENNIARKALSIDLNIAYSTVSDWMTGKSHDMIYDILTKLADYLNTTVDSLLNSHNISPNNLTNSKQRNIVPIIY